MTEPPGLEPRQDDPEPGLRQIRGRSSRRSSQSSSRRLLRRQRQTRLWLILVSVAVLLLVSLIVAEAAYRQLGHTPGRLMDYAERRLEGHPKLEAVALPVLALFRESLHEPALNDRLAEPFDVPLPPSPWTAEALQPPSPADTVAPGRVLRVGLGEAISTIAEAARQARDGDTVEILAGEYRGDVAVWGQRRLTIRGVGGNARLHADGRSAEAKAIWVIRNGDFVIENIDFIGTKVADGNGAGIRFENGSLVVRNCLFWGNQSGILTSSGPSLSTARLEVERSEFGYNGDGIGQAHQLYAGNLALLRVTGSYFHHGNVGHLIKSRAAVNDIRYNRLTDEGGGRASYEIDLPNGGLGVIVGNIVQQNRRTENTALISFGVEGYDPEANRLYLMSNTLVNDHPYGGRFLRAKPGAQTIIAANNVRSGPGRYHADAALQIDNDLSGEWTLFNAAVRHDYRLSAEGRQLAYKMPLQGRVQGLSLVPEAEYVHPRQVRPLKGPPVSVGALQTGVPEPR